MTDILYQRAGRLAPSGTISDEDLALINHYALRALSREDVIVRSALVANDQVDSYFTRFSKGALDLIAQMLPGTPVMRNHGTWSSDDLPVGIWFRSDVEERDGANWVRGWFYMVREPLTDSIGARMDGGVIREVSLSWMMRAIDVKCSICGRNEMDPLCDHVPGLDYNGALCVWDMTNVRSVEEASLVWKGGQYGTKIEMPDGSEKRITLMQRSATRRAAHAAATPAGGTSLETWFKRTSLEDWFSAG